CGAALRRTLRLRSGRAPEGGRPHVRRANGRMRSKRLTGEARALSSLGHGPVPAVANARKSLEHAGLPADALRARKRCLMQNTIWIHAGRTFSRFRAPVLLSDTDQYRDTTSPAGNVQKANADSVERLVQHTANRPLSQPYSLRPQFAGARTRDPGSG